MIHVIGELIHETYHATLRICYFFRYMAISKPIEYARNIKNNIRVKATIFLVWFISLVIALPVVTGLNNLDDTHHCEFTNATYIVASSLGSFYLPCIVMVILYSIVLKNLRKRRRIRKKQKAPKLNRAIATNGQHKGLQYFFFICFYETGFLKNVRLANLKFMILNFFSILINIPTKKMFAK